MRTILSAIFIVSICFYSNAQVKEKVDSLSVTKKKDSIIYWTNKNSVGLDISEVGFINWSSGGSNSISGLLKLELTRNFKDDNTVWDNKFRASYGVNKQEESSLRKTDDVLELTSTYGYKNEKMSNWYSSVKFSFKTQFQKGYKYSASEDDHVSKFMAPGYLFLGVGTIYEVKKKKLKAYISPLTLKSTFVLDQGLANTGAFGVEKAIYDADGILQKEGKTSRSEIGALLTSTFESTIMENITLQNSMSFYTDYIKNAGNIDVDWEMKFKFKVNDYVRATFVSHIKYDDDIKIAANESEGIEASGAKVQWKQLLGVGVVYAF